MAKFSRSKKPATEEASAPPEALSDANIAAALDERYGGEPLVVAEAPPDEEASEDVLPEAPEALSDENIAAALDERYGGEPLVVDGGEPLVVDGGEPLVVDGGEHLEEGGLIEPAPVTSEGYDGPGYAAPTFSYVEAAAQAEAANLLTPSSTKGNANGAPEELPPAPRDNSKNSFARDIAKLNKTVLTLGQDKGKGDKSLIALVDVLLDAVEAGLITPGNVDKNGKKIPVTEKNPDDAVKMYLKFREGRDAAAGRFAPKEGEVQGKVQGKDSLDSQASKLRQIIKAGALGINGIKDVFATARDIHTAAMDDLQKREFLKHAGTYEALVQIAREQLKKENYGLALTEEQIRDVLFTEEREAKDKTGLDYIKSAYKAACAARDGKAATESKEARAPIDHGNLEHAIGHLDAVIRELDPSYFDKIEAEAAQKMAAWTARQANKKAA